MLLSFSFSFVKVQYINKDKIKFERKQFSYGCFSITKKKTKQREFSAENALIIFVV